jgi:hypothetical protein
VVGWALIDDENGDSSVHALLSLGAGVTSSYDIGPRYLGAARGGDYAARLVDQWEGAASAYMEEYGEPGAEGGEEGGGEEGQEGGEGQPEGGDAPPAASAT